MLYWIKLFIYYIQTLIKLDTAEKYYGVEGREKEFQRAMRKKSRRHKKR